MTNDFNDLLSNVRIVEWDQFYAAPGASALLGDMGAEVISIERFDRPSPTRTMRHIGRGDFTLSDGSSGLFETVSRNKSSVALNMHDVAGQELAREMVRNSDVFLTNFREPSLVRAGMNSKLLTAEHPGLIYSKVSGFGPEGPRSDQSGFDFIVQGYSGMMHRFGDDSRELGAPVDLMLDQTASIFTALSIIAALYHRERTGHGQVLDTSLLGTALNIYFNDALMALNQGKKLDRHSQEKPGNPLRNYYECSDGKWLICAHNPPGRYVADLSRMLDMEPAEISPDQPQELVVQRLSDAFRRRPRSEWLEEAQRYDVVFAPVNTFPEVVAEEQVVENYIESLTTESGVDLRMAAFATSFSKTPVYPRAAAKTLGFDTRSTLRSICDVSDDELDKLERNGVISGGGG